MNRIITIAAAAAIAIVPASLLAQAGIVVQQKTTFNVARVTSADLTSTTSILGSDRAKTVTTGKVKVLIMSVDASGTEITRLDQDQVIKLDDKKKKYEVQSLAQKRADLAKQQKDAEKSATEAQEKDNMRYYAVVDEAKRTGDKKVINGFNTEQVSIKITVMGENTKTGQKAPYMHLIADLWMDPSQKEAGRIYMAYETAQRQALGVDPAMATNPYAKWVINVNAEMAKLEGFPIRSTMSFESEVDSATAAANKEGKPAGGMGALGGLFGKKKEEPANASGRPVLFTSTTEVLSISTIAPPATEFDIPAGYVKK